MTNISETFGFNKPLLSRKYQVHKELSKFNNNMPTKEYNKIYYRMYRLLILCLLNNIIEIRL